MPENSENLLQIMDHLFRHESGKMVSILTGIFGIEHLELVEDVVQDTLLKAMETWKFNGLPQNPSAWLFRVARNKAIDILRQKKFTTRITDESEFRERHEETFFRVAEIRDDQLRMMFTCCDPVLSDDVQVALTLKTLCGFGTREIAKAFLVPETTMEKKIYRAKELLREKKARFEIPIGHELTQRLDQVLSTLYLMFNEGYLASDGERLLRENLSLEALRLIRLICEHPNTCRPKSDALAALMCFHAARFPSRTDSFGNMITLSAQDHTKWDHGLIKEGVFLLNRSAEGNEISEYHLEAAIAYEYASSSSFQATDWKKILEWYDILMQIKPSPVRALQRSIIVAQIYGAESGLKEIFSIKDREKLEKYHLYFATLGEFYAQLHRFDESINYLKKSIELTSSLVEKNYLYDKIRQNKGRMR